MVQTKRLLFRVSVYFYAIFVYIMISIFIDVAVVWVYFTGVVSVSAVEDTAERIMDVDIILEHSEMECEKYNRVSFYGGWANFWIELKIILMRMSISSKNLFLFGVHLRIKSNPKSAIDMHVISSDHQ